MLDGKKVIKGLEYCTLQARKGWPYEPEITKSGCEIYACPYIGNCEDMLFDAIALLKEQEPILLENQHKPHGISTNANSPWISRCPRCGKKVEGKQTRFCKYCGQAVKWE